jgi:chromosome segregation ATPase
MKKVLRGKSNCDNMIAWRPRLATGVSLAVFSSLRIKIYLCFGWMAMAVSASAQVNPDYEKVLTERSDKIVKTLGITDSSQYRSVLNEIVHQYAGLNAIHDQQKQVVATLKAGTGSAEEKAQVIKKEEEKKSAALRQLHDGFLRHLKEKKLSETQIEQIKDGMTYRVMPGTYAAYQDMIPTLTKPQKEQIYNWLVEARELAMDEGSSDDKHKVFGKYKGRINNYLSAAGYDLKKETAAWQQRLKEKQNGK